MIADLGLIATIGICAWIALDASGWRDRPGFARLSVLAAAVIAWCAGELLLRHAADLEAALWSRRLLYAGLCAFGPVWLWTVAGVRTPAAVRPYLSAVVATLATIEAFIYSSLFWSPALLVAGSGLAPTRGVLFPLHAGVQWLSIGLAMSFLFTAVWRLSGARRRAALALIGGSATPLIGNWLYFALGSSWGDPTPILVGCGAVAFRLYALDIVGRSPVTDFARAELLDQMEVGILVADSDGQVLDANACARRLIDGREPVDQRLQDVVAPFMKDPGFDVRCFPIVRRGLEVGEGCIVSDRRDARAQERRAEMGSRMEALGLLSRGLAHEINNPLTIVLGNASLAGPVLGGLAKQLPEGGARAATQDVRDLVDRIEEGGNRIASVVSRMSDLAKPDPEGEMPGVEVLALVRRAIGLAGFGNASGRIQTEAPSQALLACARAEDVVEIVLHLLRNAIEASPADRPVRVRIEATEHHAVVRVLDRGNGLPQENPSVVFDPFYTSKSPGGGIGLGLGLCWELARQNGGELEALHRPSGGAEFRLRLPRA